jgi:hypothetical protein
MNVTSFTYVALVATNVTCYSGEPHTITVTMDGYSHDPEEFQVTPPNDTTKHIFMTPTCTPQTWYRDSDSDGYGGLSDSLNQCNQPAGYVPNSTDCNDGNAAINPGATEICDGIDQDCNELTECFVVMHIDESSENGLPLNWTIIDNAGTSAEWRFDNPGNRANETGGAGAFAIADSDHAGPVDMETELRSRIMDMSNLVSVSIEFKTDFYYYAGGGSEVADVDISTNGPAGPWTNVWRKTGADYRGPRTEVLDVSAIAAGQSNVMVRFHYQNANWDWWWQIDDIQIFGTVNEQCDAPVRIEESCCLYYPGLQEAYDYAADGDTIQSGAVTFTEDMYFDRNKEVYIEGGYDCGYMTVIGNTRINGSIIIDKGLVTFENITAE